MRIISGVARGTKLFTLEGETTRPTLDRVKESLFNIIQNEILNSKFLDLFAGSGAIGIEAISRGAEKVVFVDSSKESINIIKQNLQVLKEQATIIFSDYSTALSRLKNAEFDIIFLDPPYEFKEIKSVFKLILENNVLTSSGIIIYESLFDKNVNKEVQGFNIIKSKKYGITAIDIYEVE